MRQNIDSVELPIFEVLKKTLESLLIILENKGYDVDGLAPNFMVHESLIENIGFET